MRMKRIPDTHKDGVGGGNGEHGVVGEEAGSFEEVEVLTFDGPRLLEGSEDVARDGSQHGHPRSGLSV
jgi:hypothetical protein